jgi:hypothetical protein
MKFRLVLVLVLGLGLLPAAADASLTGFQTFTGPVGLSTDGFGSLTQSGTISANVPAGAVVLGAYLYTSTFNNGSLTGVSATLNGNAVVFASLGTNTDACCQLTAARADVTSIVAPVINGGLGGNYDFAITEGSSSQDGEALVVVYSLVGNPDATVGILDGFAKVSGDTTSINFSQALNPAAPGFFADMRLGIGFSCCDVQFSTVEVNNTVITERAGNMDDADVQSPANGRLFTMGGDDDAFSALLPDYESDTEHYNLVPFITAGDTSIVVETFNQSENDNIFVATFYVSGIAGVNEPPPDGTPIPEPASMTLVATGLAYAARRYRGRKRQ